MIRLLVDSGSDYTLAEVEGRGIEFVPLSVTIAGTTSRDGVNLTKDEFYRLLLESDDFPKTALPSPADFADIFEDVKAKGDEIICILLASVLSGTYQSAVTAKAMVDYDKIHIIDSCTATCGIRLLVEYADRLRGQNLSAAEIVEKIEAVKGRTRICAALDTLEYLHKGGRLSRASAAIGTAVSLKPVISLDPQGRVEVIQKCLGRGRALNYVVSYLEKHPADPDFPIYPVFTCGTENAGKLQARLAEQNIPLHPLSQLGSTIGAHVGPEIFGVIYIEQ